MNSILKIALGIGAAAAAAALAVSLSKKNEEPENVDIPENDDIDETEGLNECDECCCEDCEAWNGDECECEDDCCSCDECDDCGSGCEVHVNPDIKAAVNSIVDGVMGGIVVAADKVSELTTKLADFVSVKLDERKASEVSSVSFDWDEEDDEDEAPEAEPLAEKVEDAAEDIKEAAEDVAEDVKEAFEDVKDDLTGNN